MSHIGLTLAKAAAGFCGSRWPQTTANFAFKLFSRVPRARRPTSSQLDGTAPIMLQTRSGVVATWHLPAPCRTGRTVLIVHGWNSRSDHLATLARRLNEGGIDVVLLDLPGHGASGGRYMNLGTAIAAVDAAWRQYGPFEAFVGHSFGGVVVLNAAIGASMCVPARRPQRLVMIASPNSMPDFFRQFGRWLGLPRPAQAALEYKVFSILGRSLDLFVCAQQLKDINMPVLVVHDTHDADVPFADAQAMVGAGPHVSLHATAGLGHRRILKDASVMDAICNHIAGNVQVQSGPVPLAECA